MQKKFRTLVFIAIMTLTSISLLITTTNAAVQVFDDTYVTDDEYIMIMYNVAVWSNKHVEVEVNYKHHSTNPDMCTFWYFAIRIGGVYGDVYSDDNISEHAPNEWKYAYLDGYADDWAIDIDIQMKTISYEYLTKYAIYQLVVFSSGWAFVGSYFILLNSNPAFPVY